MKRTPFTYAEEQVDLFDELLRDLPSLVPDDVPGDAAVITINATTAIPARLWGGNAQSVEVSGFDYTLHLDMSKLPEGLSTFGQWTIAWDETANIYTRVPFTPGGDGGPTGWDDITDKPATFPPSPHTHYWAEITDKPTTFPPEQEATEDLIAATLVAGANVTITYDDDGLGKVTIAATGGSGGSGTPGGTTTQVQFNNAGAFGGDPDFTFDPATNNVRIARGHLEVGSVLGDAGGDVVANGTLISRNFAGVPSYGYVGFGAAYEGNLFFDGLTFSFDCYVTAPTPPLTDDSIKVATTAWARDNYGTRTISTVAPTTPEGVNGDIWFQVAP